eukprot:1640840-Amphidinium_carterae.2
MAPQCPLSPRFHFTLANNHDVIFNNNMRHHVQIVSYIIYHDLNYHATAPGITTSSPAHLAH